MQHVKVTATPAANNPLLAYTTDPNGGVVNTPVMVGGVWEANLNAGVYYFSLTVTGPGGSACEIAVAEDGAVTRDIKYSLPGAPAGQSTYTETWLTSVK
ncbi:MAG TPA: hypothetical protein VGI95_03675 [Caulobacteraceae bacterium]|jgi:hypothetical protein